VGDFEVRLETHFARIVSTAEWERGHHFSGVVAGSGEARALEEDLEEDLGVEGKRRRVEWRSVDGLIDLVRTGDRVAGQQADDLEGREVPRIGKALQDGRNAVLGLL
jgi:hypothetical protein